MESGNRFKMIVFNIEKSNNAAMISRSAYAFGCDELLIVGRQKMSMTGAAGTSQVQRRRHFFTLDDAVTYCHDQGFAIYGLEIGGLTIDQADFNRDVAFILGNEGRGLADAARFCDQYITIPQWGGVPSLNVAVAGSIAMYEFQRRQGRAPAHQYRDTFYDENFPTTTN